MRRSPLLITVILLASSLSGADKLPEGHGSLKWGAPLKQSKKNISGKMTYTDDKKVIMSKDGNLTYHYGFFATEDKPEGRLFYVSVKFPYLGYEEVLKKIKKKYGEPSSEKLSDNKGAVAWDSDKTILIIIIDSYEDKPFCRRMIYISKEITAEMNEYQKNVFNKVEREVMEKLNP